MIDSSRQGGRFLVCDWCKISTVWVPSLTQEMARAGKIEEAINAAGIAASWVVVSTETSVMSVCTTCQTIAKALQAAKADAEGIPKLITDHKFQSHFLNGGYCDYIIQWKTCSQLKEAHSA